MKVDTIDVPAGRLWHRFKPWLNPPDDDGPLFAC
jgi:hypothetical protein